ncbi:MAG: hypothetical protein ACE5EL_07340, partial [Anaerolineae bacterium]
MLSSPRVVVLYERGTGDPRAFGSAYLRLIRPLSHPGAGLDVTFATAPPETGCEVCIIDRLWYPGLGPDGARELLAGLRAAGARIIHALDDNLLDVDAAAAGLPAHAAEVARILAAGADGVLVTTTTLAERLGGVNPNVVVLPNALDERLLVPRAPAEPRTPFGHRPLTIGYMGTRTHEADLRLVVPALQAAARHHKDLAIEVVGGVGDETAAAMLDGLPWRRVRPVSGPVYPLFMVWWTSEVEWDVALAPLASTPLNACKSDIKILDYAAIGAATLASNCAAYVKNVASPPGAVLVDNEDGAWEAALL